MLVSEVSPGLFFFSFLSLKQKLLDFFFFFFALICESGFGCRGFGCHCRAGGDIINVLDI